MSRYFGRFNRYQSCGKCVPCRIGTKNLLHMVDRIALGNSKPEDIPIMKKWSDHVVKCRCAALARPRPCRCVADSATSWTSSTEHINDKHCEAGRCDVLVKREQENLKHTPAWLEEKFFPARIGERYRQQFGAITQISGNGTGTAPAATAGKAVSR